MYEYGLIGNCQVSALVSPTGSIDWLCFPRPDSPPVFGKILDPEGGQFSIEGVDAVSSRQRYLPNTTILKTTVTCQNGGIFEITDFCPRFHQHGRMYRPLSIFRIVEPVRGSPALRVRFHPVNGWSKTPAHAIRGNSHLRYDILDDHLRLVTNMPLTYLSEETPFTLKEKIYFALTWSSGIEDDLVRVTHDFLHQTEEYWKNWVKHCSIPVLHQSETIRSALVAKLHCYEDTGAILAALTTSLPEEPGQVRNWDYRYCWLRDAYFCLSAFHKLGHFEEMEGFLKFILSIAQTQEHNHDRLAPVYRLDQSLPLPETEHPNWSGYLRSHPVRSGNQAAEHIQNDVYGEMILALTPIFFDERFQHLRTHEHEHLLAHLANLATKNISQPDAGLWEFRNGWQEHTFSNLLSWAGLDRIHRIQERGFLRSIDFDVQTQVEKARQAVLRGQLDGALRNGPKDKTLDASLLQAAILRFPDDTLIRNTVLLVQKELQSKDASGFLYRYRRADDFGTPSSAFMICSFWLVQALVACGDLEGARRTMNQALQASNSLGLIAEHWDPKKKLQCGNFPQAYSHVGLINAAFAVSPTWDQVL